MMETRKVIAVGIDLGKLGEPSAVAVVQRIEPFSLSDKVEYHVRHLERFPLNTEYSRIGAELIKIFNCEAMNMSDLEVRMIIDQTAVGAKIADHVMHGTGRTGRRVIISSNGQDVRYADGLNYIPTQTLIGNLQVFLETGQLKIGRNLAASKQFVEELLSRRNRKTTSISLGDMWREGPSDDLIFAAGLAVYEAQLPPEFSWEFL